MTAKGALRTFADGSSLPLFNAPPEFLERLAFHRGTFPIRPVLELRLIAVRQAVVDDVEDALLEVPFGQPYRLRLRRSRLAVIFRESVDFILRLAPPR